MLSNHILPLEIFSFGRWSSDLWPWRVEISGSMRWGIVSVRFEVKLQLPDWKGAGGRLQPTLSSQKLLLSLLGQTNYRNLFAQFASVSTSLVSLVWLCMLIWFEIQLVAYCKLLYTCGVLHIVNDCALSQLSQEICDQGFCLLDPHTHLCRCS